MDGSSMFLLALCAAIAVRGGAKGVGYEAFLSGAEDGLHSAVRLVPALTAMTLAVELCRAGGLTALLTGLLAPLLSPLGVPAEALPAMLLRPLTGSGSLAALRALMAQVGPDSRAARLAAVVCGSSETILYTMTVYLSAAGVRKLPRVLPVSLAAWCCGCVVAVLCV